MRSAEPFSDLEGRVLQRARVEEHVHRDTRTLLRVELAFADGSSVVLGTSADGDSLTRKHPDLRPYEMAQYGRVEVGESEVIAERLPSGTVISEVSELINADGKTFGVTLNKLGRALHIFTVGDDLYVSAKLPPDIEALLGH